MIFYILFEPCSASDGFMSELCAPMIDLLPLNTSLSFDTVWSSIQIISATYAYDPKYCFPVRTLRCVNSTRGRTGENTE